MWAPTYTSHDAKIQTPHSRLVPVTDWRTPRRGGATPCTRDGVHGIARPRGRVIAAQAFDGMSVPEHAIVNGTSSRITTVMYTL